MFTPHICASIKRYSWKYPLRAFTMTWKTSGNVRWTQKWSNILDLYPPLSPRTSPSPDPPKPMTTPTTITRNTSPLPQRLSSPKRTTNTKITGTQMRRIALTQTRKIAGTLTKKISITQTKKTPLPPSSKIPTLNPMRAMTNPTSPWRT